MTVPVGPAGPSARDAARSVRNRARYRFDDLLSRGTWAVLLWLGAMTLTVIVASTVILTLFRVTFSGSGDSSVFEDFWQTLLRILDPGTMAGDVGWGRRVLALVVTLSGILVAGTLIGLIAAGFERRIDEMRRGRSIVVESGHFVVLGWSERMRVIVEQLTAGTDGADAVVVIVADRDAPDMEDELRSAVVGSRGRRVICRSGDPRRSSTLGLANLYQARAVVVLADENDPDGADVVTTVLAVGKLIGFDRVPIVAELAGELVSEKLIRATGPAVHPVIPTMSAARIATLVLRQRGLSEVIEELLDANGADILVDALPDLVGVTFADATFRFDEARPIGLIRRGGMVEINPPGSALIEPGDRLVAIGSSVDKLVPMPSEAAPSTGERLVLTAERTEMQLLFIGWNRLATSFLGQFDQSAVPGSTALVMYDDDVLTASDIRPPALRNIQFSTMAGSDPVTALESMACTSVILLSYENRADADSRTLLDLRLLKNEIVSRPLAAPQLLVQLLNSERAELADMVGFNDYIVSDVTGSQLIAQLMRSPERRKVFHQLYMSEGPSLHLVAASRLHAEDASTFRDVVRAAHAAGVIAIGWVGGPERGGRTHLSPSLSDPIRLDPSDRVVVIG